MCDVCYFVSGKQESVPPQQAQGDIRREKRYIITCNDGISTGDHPRDEARQDYAASQALQEIFEITNLVAISTIPS